MISDVADSQLSLLLAEWTRRNEIGPTTADWFKEMLYQVLESERLVIFTDSETKVNLGFAFDAGREIERRRDLGAVASTMRYLHDPGGVRVRLPKDLVIGEAVMLPGGVVASYEGIDVNGRVVYVLVHTGERRVF